MVCGHKRHTCRRQQTVAVQFTAIEQHLAKRCVISRGGEEAATPGNPLGAAARVEHRRSLAGSGLDLRLRRTVSRNRTEGRILEAERPADAVKDEQIKRHPGGDFNNPSKHIRRHSVLPGAAGLVGERNGREPRNHVGIALLDVDHIGRLVGLPQKRACQHRIRKT